MGQINCCNRKEEESGKMTIFYNSREKQIADFKNSKAKGNYGFAINETNMLDNESIFSGLKDDNIKKIVLIQSRYFGISFRSRFKELRLELLREHEFKIKEIGDLFFSIYEKNLANLNKDNYENKKIYFDSNDKPIKVFQSCIAKYELDNIISFYKGEVNIFNQKHGYGTLYFKDNSYYQGYWVIDSFSAFGRFTDIKGVLYEGTFLNGKLNGEGIKLSEKGLKKGTLIEGILQGYGIEDNADHTYEGNFFNDLKSGQGKYFFKQLNETYEGESKDNTITGLGKYIWNNSNFYEGTFLNGKMHGKGKYIWPDGAEYEGDYVDNIKQGLGRFKWANGKFYEGEFANGKPHGKGIICYSNNSKYQIIFEDGKPMSKTIIN